MLGRPTSRRTHRALVARFRIQKTNAVQWRYMPMSSAQNNAFYELLRRYAPLFPQRSDTEPRALMPPVFTRGQRRHRYPRPRPLAYPLLPSPYNKLLAFNRMNTNTEQETWQLDTKRHEWVDLEDADMEEWEVGEEEYDEEEYEEDEDEDEDDEEDDDDDDESAPETDEMDHEVFPFAWSSFVIS